MTLAEFLLARFSEDESKIHYLDLCDCATEGFPLQHGMFCPTRIRADYDAKRLLVSEAIEALRAAGVGMANIGFLARRVLAMLAIPYIDHPDFQEEWKL